MMTRDEILRAALIGYEHKKTEIDVAIAEIQSELSLKAALSPKRAKTASGIERIQVVHVTGLADKQVKVKRKMSRAARQRISEATKKRWAVYRRQHGIKKVA